MINRKQYGFCTNYSFKILVSERKYKSNLKNHESQKNTCYNSHIDNDYVKFYYKIPWFYQDFKSENLCYLNLYSVHAARLLNLTLGVMLCPPK